MSNHLLIAGTGRAGTTFLIRLFDACGLDTGLDRLGQTVDAHANAGIEVLPNAPGDLPYVIKSPWSHHVLEDALTRCQRTIDHLVVPVRHLEDAAASRVTLQLAAVRRSGATDESWPPDGMWDTWDAGPPGGITYSLEPLDQERILAVALHRLIETAVRHDVPMVFLDFPRIVEDREYAYARLSPVIGSAVSEPEFARAFTLIADASKVRIDTRTTKSEDGSGADGRDANLTALERADLRALRMALSSARHEASAASDEAKRAEVIARELAARVNGLEEELHRLHDARRAMEHELVAQRQALTDVLQSPSWKVTRPLRQIKSAFKTR